MAPVHYPVVVIGSGPTGLTLANLLGCAGVGVLLVERNSTTVSEPRAVSIDDEALRTMQAAGLSDAVLADVVPGYGSRYYAPSGFCFAKVEPTEAPFGYPKRNAFRQPLLERTLRAGLARFSTVEARYGWQFETLEQVPEQVTVRLRDSQGTPHLVTADYLVGCDGADSTVRRALGVALEGTSFAERWLILDLEHNENPSPHTTVFCDWRRPCITLPGPHRTRRFEFKLFAHERDEDFLRPETIGDLLATHGADPNATLVRKVVYRFHARVVRHWREGRAFLAGDAAHLSPPFAGQGMNSGIRDAHNLSWKLAAVLNGTFGPALLDTYETERCNHAWEMIRLALRMGRIFAPKNRWHGFAHEALFLGLRLIPPAYSYVVQMKYRPQARFTDGFMVADAVMRSLCGRMFPQPRLRAGGGEVLLDTLLGSGFALVTRTSRPHELFGALDHPIWGHIDVRKVTLLPRDSGSVAAPPDVCVAVEADDALAHFPDEVAWLVRPDRYVAAALPAAGLERALAEAARLIGRYGFDGGVC